MKYNIGPMSHDGWGPSFCVGPLSALLHQGQITRLPPPFSMQAKATNGAIYTHGLAGFSCNKLSLPSWDKCAGRSCFCEFMHKEGSEGTQSDVLPLSKLATQSITLKYWHRELIMVSFCAAPFTFLSWPVLNQLTATWRKKKGNSEWAPDFFLTLFLKYISHLCWPRSLFYPIFFFFFPVWSYCWS